MKKFSTSILFLLLVLGLSQLGYTFEFSAVTVFGCDDNGTQDTHARWNTGPVDGCWDIFMYEGDLVKQVDQARWMNDQGSRLVKFGPKKGSITYTFHIESNIDLK